MKIFVTGGTGFIGSHFLSACVGKKLEVIALKRHSSNNISRYYSQSVAWLEKEMADLAVEDLSGVDVVVHFASAGVSPKRAAWAELLRCNVVDTLHLAQVAKLAGVRRLVVAGTFAEYGRSGERFDKIPPTASLEPTYGYAASKAAAFVALHAFAIENSLELVYLRIFSAFGEGQYEGNFWPSLRQAALEGRDFSMTPGEQVRDYIAVNEVANIFLKHATETEVALGAPIVANVGSGQAVTMREFAEKWWRAFGAKGELRVGALPYRKDEVMKYIPLVEAI